MQKFQVHINWLKVTSTPFLHASQPLSPSEGTDINRLMWFDQVPWIGTTVLVAKTKHALKGCHGIVKNVLRGQETSSGLRVAIQLSSWNPACPFKTVVLDYDDVVEAVYVTPY